MYPLCLRSLLDKIIYDLGLLQNRVKLHGRTSLGIVERGRILPGSLREQERSVFFSHQLSGTGYFSQLV